jgi:hypothetical protein
VEARGLVIVGAWYELETGQVRFLEETLPA